MINLFIDHPWKILITNHVLLLAQFTNIDPAPQLSLSHDVSDAKVNHFQFDLKGLFDIFDGLDGGLFGISLGLGANDDHPAWFEDEYGAFRFGFPHDDCGESLLVVAAALNLLSNQLKI